MTLDLTETILGASAHADSLGVTWERRLDRFGGDSDERVSTAYLLFHEGDVTKTTWRDTLRWTTENFPEFFEPVVNTTTDDDAFNAGGMGAYSCADAADMYANPESLPVKPTNVWDAHFYWPYVASERAVAHTHPWGNHTWHYLNWCHALADMHVLRRGSALHCL